MISEIQILRDRASDVREARPRGYRPGGPECPEACENKGDTEEAREWRHIEDAMKMMRGPHQS